MKTSKMARKLNKNSTIHNTGSFNKFTYERGYIKINLLVRNELQLENLFYTLTPIVL
jgi:hypothetical protein